jgi:PHD-finger
LQQMRPDVAAKEEDERELYCLCQQPYNVDTAMISCDACHDWYHLRCVGVSQTQARSLRKYSCPICAAIRVRQTHLR